MANKKYSYLEQLRNLLMDRSKKVSDLIVFLENSPEASKILLSASETAEILGLSRSRIYALLRQGQLKGFKKKKFWQVKFDYIEEYIQNYRCS
ncbi:helix-turn-helix domain-containing protein [Aquirufa beregesia]